MIGGLWLAAGAVGGVAAAAGGAHALLVAPKDLRITRIVAPIDGLGAAFDGYTIAVLTDMHQWPGGGLRVLERAVAAANASRPDAVVLLGDYSVSFGAPRLFNRGWYERAMAAMAPVLRRLGARDGVYAVLGNHDYFYDGARVAEWLRSLGTRPLVNGSVTVRRDGDELVLCGVDDVQEGRVDVDAAYADAAPDVPTVLLSHNPDVVLQLPRDRRADLVLSGHTHGGQYIVPGYGAITTQSDVCTRTDPAGWVPNARGVPLYVSRGVGGQTPGRVLCPPEVVVVTLKPAAVPDAEPGVARRLTTPAQHPA